MLVIVRMNREFMAYMCKHHNDLTQDHFGKTIIDADEPQGEKE